MIMSIRGKLKDLNNPRNLKEINTRKKESRSCKKKKEIEIFTREYELA